MRSQSEIYCANRLYERLEISNRRFLNIKFRSSNELFY